MGGVPRTRGDGPAPGFHPVSVVSGSPHTRGWTARRTCCGCCGCGFPAHAGMDPLRRAVGDRAGRVPRTRGDGPSPSIARCVQVAGSPHTRGWTTPARGHFSRDPGFPAHAGMDPAPILPDRDHPRVPRTRGDGPPVPRSPGCRRRGSPHTRGWTLVPGRRGGSGRGFPAHAGMDRPRRSATGGRTRVPRTRGDGPQCARGAAPAGRGSPHTRGWTRGVAGRGGTGTGFPAHAGMDPLRNVWTTSGARVPRTRGDGPWQAVRRTTPTSGSPHTRGWTRSGRDADTAVEGFPAHAGMDPSSPPEAFCLVWVPRTRGDGPFRRTAIGDSVEGSPHTRGWTAGAPAARCRP